jgi:hypothetical protein
MLDCRRGTVTSIAHLLNDFGESIGVEVGHLMAKGTELILPILPRIAPRDDGNHSALDWIAAERNLCRITRAETLTSGERETSQALEQRALAG